MPMKPVGLLFVTADNPMPNAKWRKKFAESSMAIKSKPILAFVSTSPVMRGIVTAVNWIRPAPFEFEILSTFDRGVAFLEDRRGAPLPRLGEMFGECRAELKLPPGIL